MIKNKTCKNCMYFLNGAGNCNGCPVWIKTCRRPNWKPKERYSPNVHDLLTFTDKFGGRGVIRVVSITHPDTCVKGRTDTETLTGLQETRPRRASEAWDPNERVGTLKAIAVWETEQFITEVESGLYTLVWRYADEIEGDE